MTLAGRRSLKGAVFGLVLQSPDVRRRDRQEHGQFLEPLKTLRSSDVVVVVALGGDVDDDDDYLNGDQAQNDDDRDGEHSHACMCTTPLAFHHGTVSRDGLRSMGLSLIHI